MVGNPFAEENLIHCYGNVPDNYEPFVHTESPMLGVYETRIESNPVYEKVNGVWTNVWSSRQMTDDEKIAKQNDVKDYFYKMGGSKYWIFNEVTCDFDPPTPHPMDGKPYIWSEEQIAWIFIPDYPNDGNKYFLDRSTNPATWILKDQQSIA